MNDNAFTTFIEASSLSKEEIENNFLELTQDYQDYYYFNNHKSHGLYDTITNSLTGEKRHRIETLVSFNFFIPFVHQNDNEIKSHWRLAIHLRLHNYFENESPSIKFKPGELFIRKEIATKPDAALLMYSHIKDIDMEKYALLNKTGQDLRFNNRVNMDKMHINDGTLKSFIMNMNKKYASGFFDSIFPDNQLAITFNRSDKLGEQKILPATKQKSTTLKQYDKKLQELLQSLDNKEINSQGIDKDDSYNFIDLLKTQESRGIYNNLSSLLEDKPLTAKKKI